MTAPDHKNLAEAFARELPTRLKELQILWRGPERGTQASLQRIQQIAHNLAGAGAAHSYLTLAEVALQVEDCIAGMLENFGHNDSARQQTLYQHLNALGALLAHPQQQAQALPVREPVQSGSEAASRRIVIVDDDVHYARFLAAEIAHFGFTVDHLASIEEFPPYLATHTPDLIIMDVMFPEGPNGPQVIEQLRHIPNNLAPVIFISGRDSLDSRLAAIRAGGHAFFRKPFQVIDLLDTVDHVLGLERRAPYRVLIVEDAASLARLYAATLEAAGMLTEVLTQPLTLLTVLDRFRPDLILMDIYMPDVNGVELAQVIQQHRRYFGIPIIFLSAERDLAKQLLALGQGGDNFLTKPVDPDNLVRAVSIRARHYQSLRALMLKDSLTGLLNHSRLLEQLDHEIERASRRGSPLSVALIDIDHLKMVNERCGHVVGDHVIVSLGRLLRERLRATDIIGRYSGEEFLLILPDTVLSDAMNVVDDLRNRFAALHQHAKETVFQVTFSAGIAEFIASQAVDRNIVERADCALQAAKAAGRNCLRTP
jgi:diguanylate cyclase (GGDEF)-like protein